MAYTTQSRDTEEWAERFLVERWRTMEPWEKAELLNGLDDSLHEITLAGLAQRHPGASAEELEVREACLRLGPAIVRLVRGWVPGEGA